MVVIFVTLLNVALAAPIPSLPNTEYREYDLNALEKIKVTNTSGSTTVTPVTTSAHKATISILKRGFTERCKVTILRPGHDLITAEIKNFPGDRCEADITITAPKTANIEITSGSGVVNVSGLEGSLSFNLGSGKLEADGKFTRVEGTSGSGSVKVSGVRGGGSVEVGTGEVEVSFLENIAGNFKIRTGSGDATMKFPKGTKLRASLDTGRGSVSNEFEHADKADMSVSAETGSGDLQIKSY